MHAILDTAKEPIDRRARCAPGSTLGPWRLAQLQGEGAWTQVFLAAPLDSTSRSTTDYVIKVIKPEFAEDPRVIALMQREAFLSKTVSHRHLACVLSAHVERAPLFLVMPFQTGANVANLIKNRDRLPPAQALWIIRQAAEGLCALHDADWLHGDVKPNNIYMAVNGHVTLCDLGFARRLSELDKPRDFVLGTPAYLAPELLTGSVPITRASDVYALAVSLFEMLTGSRPFNQTDEAELAAAHRLLPAPDPRAIVPQLLPSVCRLLRRMLAKEPLRRPVGSELIDELVDLEIEAFDYRG